MGQKPLERGVPVSGPRSLHGIDPRRVVEEFAARDLDSMTDTDLYRQAAVIVSKPPAQGLTSFTLHAPLELMARYAVLPWVDPAERSLARLQIVASAAAYESGVTSGELPNAASRFLDLETARRELQQAFPSGDVSRVESLAIQIAAQFGVFPLVRILAPLALTTLTAASHAHIGLWLLLRHGTVDGVVGAELLRAALRLMSADPGGRLTSFSGMQLSGRGRLPKTPREVEQETLEILADPPRHKMGVGGIRGFLEAGEASGNPDSLFGRLLQYDLTDAQIDAAFRAVLRVSAHCMIQHDATQSKFGWSHCLTLPQAACGLASLGIERKLGLATTLVWITTYRSSMSDQVLDCEWVPANIAGDSSVEGALQTSPEFAASRVWHAEPAEFPAVRRALATSAAIRGDQHLIKYTRACFDLAEFDPEWTQLYLAAAAHLGAVWAVEVPRNLIEESLLDGKTTP